MNDKTRYGKRATRCQRETTRTNCRPHESKTTHHTRITIGPDTYGTLHDMTKNHELRTVPTKSRRDARSDTTHPRTNSTGDRRHTQPPQVTNDTTMSLRALRSNSELTNDYTTPLLRLSELSDERRNTTIRTRRDRNGHQRTEAAATINTNATKATRHGRSNTKNQTNA